MLLLAQMSHRGTKLKFARTRRSGTDYVHTLFSTDRDRLINMIINELPSI